MYYHSLKQCIRALENSFDIIGVSRRATLESIAKIIHQELNDNDVAKVMSICTHNSRRSQLLEAWIVAALQHYDIDGVSASSGGTEATAFNIRTVVALRQAGFQLIEDVPGDNPKYILIPGKETVFQHVMYSKVYNDDYNPMKGYIALMVCDQADEACPVVKGAKHRMSLHYADPQVDDNTPMESGTYTEAVEKIGREVLYMMTKVKEQG